MKALAVCRLSMEAMKIKKYNDWLLELFAPYQTDKEKIYKEAFNRAKSHFGFNSKRHLPCWACRAIGFTRHSVGPYDMEEAACEKCSGNQYLPIQTYKEIYVLLKKENKDKMEKEKEIQNRLKEIKSKLTKDELLFLVKHHRA